MINATTTVKPTSYNHPTSTAYQHTSMSTHEHHNTAHPQSQCQLSQATENAATHLTYSAAKDCCHAAWKMLPVIFSPVPVVNQFRSFD